MIEVGAELVAYGVNIPPPRQLQADPIILAAAFGEVALGHWEDDYAGPAGFEGNTGTLVDMYIESELTQQNPGG